MLATLPFRLRSNHVSKPNNVAHENWVDYLSSHFKLIASSVALMGGEFTVQTLMHTMYPHATLNEVFPEAARAVHKQSINM